jgi:hypothetical protein
MPIYSKPLMNADNPQGKPKARNSKSETNPKLQIEMTEMLSLTDGPV